MGRGGENWRIHLRFSWGVSSNKKRVQEKGEEVQSESEERKSEESVGRLTCDRRQGGFCRITWLEDWGRAGRDRLRSAGATG